MNQKPEYTLVELKKGIVCENCGSLETEISNQYLYCNHCQTKEDATKAIVRTIEAYATLFPTSAITTKQMEIWCGYTVTINRIYRVLQRYYHPQGKNRWIYYTRKQT
ncbi:hypothetical protein [Gracilibacillus kekensis]|uniref:hypothetical protein n=1 Tax=Gracilibacillus kekensis TaxID=1027249 RepID=UPI00093499D8|nr:hypothetical protein [Gracilibacillus kekensis]